MKIRPALLAFLVAGCLGPPAPPPANGLDFQESFETHAGLPDGWRVQSGTWSIIDEVDAPSGAHVLQQSNRDGGHPPHIVAMGKGAFDRVELSVRARSMEAAGSRSGGLALRYVDSGNFYGVRLGGADGTVRFIEYTKGSQEELGPEFARAIPSDTWFTLIVRAEGDSFTVLVDGQPTLAVTDATIPVGHVGLWTEPDSILQFDDFQADRF